MSDNGIRFYRAHETLPISAFLLAQGYSEDQVSHWLDLGCVYVNGRRSRDDLNLAPEQVVRLHTRPKSYLPTVHDIPQRIRFESDDLLVFNKPSGLPTHPTLDNFKQNAKFVLENHLGATLFTTHRLDIPTAGLLIFAKTAKAQSRINRAFARGLVEKIYLAEATKHVPLGEHVHYIDGKAHVPRPITQEVQEGWWHCRLNVLAYEGPYRHRVQLLTGKTHQIRAQFAALGAPLIGDELYGGPRSHRFGLTCIELKVEGQRFVLE